MHVKFKKWYFRTVEENFLRDLFRTQNRKAKKTIHIEHINVCTCTYTQTNVCIYIFTHTHSSICIDYNCCFFFLVTFLFSVTGFFQHLTGYPNQITKVNSLVWLIESHTKILREFSWINKLEIQCNLQRISSWVALPLANL